MHKTYKDPVPLIYVDTGVYEGGSNDYYEVHTRDDLCRIDYVMKYHRIQRWENKIISDSPAAGAAAPARRGCSGSPWQRRKAGHGRYADAAPVRLRAGNMLPVSQGSSQAVTWIQLDQ